MRPEVTALLSRYLETFIAAGVAAVGLRFAVSPGPVVQGFGLLLTLVGIGWAVTALRRARFHAKGEAPGIVEVIEGRISYMGPVMGGVVAVDDLIALDVLVVAGARRCWRLRQNDGQALLIPQSAEGAEALYDVFAGLPGASQTALVTALSYSGDTALAVWRRAAVRPPYTTASVSPD
ncbi:MAG: hypothetical protein MK107_01050 [Oceanicola sp.]|jgi:hypothetical protein|nr:hypothetical protein [Oceanicola sp.]